MRSEIKVKYRHVDGWHVFTAPKLPGLYVASQDPQTAVDDVRESVRALLSHQLGVEVTVKPLAPFEQFVETVARRKAPAAGGRRLQLSSQRFELATAAA